MRYVVTSNKARGRVFSASHTSERRTQGERIDPLRATLSVTSVMRGRSINHHVAQ